MTDDELVRAFVASIEGLSDREAASRTGFSHAAIRKYRNGQASYLHAASRRKMTRRVQTPSGRGGGAYADALEAAAAELERQASELRRRAGMARRSD